MTQTASSSMRLAFYLPDLAGGGAERLTLILCQALVAAGHSVELIVDRFEGDNVARVPAGLDVTELLCRGHRRHLLNEAVRQPGALAGLSAFSRASRKPYFAASRTLSLAAHLRARRPQVLISALGYAPFIAYYARQIAGLAMPIIHVEHNTPSRAFLADDLALRRLVRLNQTKQLARDIYPRIDAVVGVSDGVADDTAEFAQIERRRVHTIYNPIPVDEIRQASRQTVDHAWVGQTSRPLLITAGRLVAQKNFPLLLEALARLSGPNSPRLIVLGEGPLRDRLARRIVELELSDRVDLYGWCAQPYGFFARADLFVQSSDREGLSTVLIEALACGCPIVATDCQSGPREILDHGQYGHIVPMHDAEALADAISQQIMTATDSQRQVARARHFSVERSTQAYVDLCRSLIAHPHHREPASGAA